MEPLVSVIVSVYNIEAYLPRCLECLKAQTYTNLEIILVNDGSTDNSGYICEAFAAKDPRARVIHHPKNVGLWAARNTGQDAATGKYLWFPDGDDYFHRDIIKIMYEAINSTGSDGKKYDLAIVGHKKTSRTDENIVSEIEPHFDEKRLEEVWEVLLRPQKFFTGRNMWNKFCRRDFVKDIRTGDYKYAQDCDFSIKLYQKEPKVVYIDNVLYFWLQHSDSAIYSMNYKTESTKFVTRIVYNNFKERKFNKIGRRYLLDFLYTFMAIWLQLARGTAEEEHVRHECKRITWRTGFSYLNCPGIYTIKKRLSRLIKIRYNKTYNSLFPYLHRSL